FAGLSLNIFALIYCAETLTESLSFTAVVFVAYCWLWSVRVFRSRMYFAPLAIGSIASAFAMMVRPANMYLPFCWGVSQMFLLGRTGRSAQSRPFVKRALAGTILVVGLLAPLLPQFYNNTVHAHRRTPLVAGNLAAFQMM